MADTLQEWAGKLDRLTVALVFTDIIDSTNLGNQVGDEQWIKVLLKHFKRARGLLFWYDGYEIKIIGDSLMVVFRTAVDALDFVTDLHKNTGDERVKIRAGIHVGPVRIIENDLFGIMVNYTKRVESLAINNWIMLSDEAKNHISYEKASRHSNLRFVSKEFQLKGFEEPKRIWRVIYPTS
jgi:class 3 adenylate cyclase